MSVSKRRLDPNGGWQDGDRVVHEPAVILILLSGPSRKETAEDVERLKRAVGDIEGVLGVLNVSPEIHIGIHPMKRKRVRLAIRRNRRTLDNDIVRAFRGV